MEGLGFGVGVCAGDVGSEGGSWGEDYGEGDEEEDCCYEQDSSEGGFERWRCEGERAPAHGDFAHAASPRFESQSSTRFLALVLLISMIWRNHRKVFHEDVLDDVDYLTRPNRAELWSLVCALPLTGHEQRAILSHLEGVRICISKACGLLPHFPRFEFGRSR